MDEVLQKQKALVDMMLDTLEAMPDKNSDEFHKLLADVIKLQASITINEKNSVERTKAATSVDIERMRSEANTLIEQTKSDASIKSEKHRTIGAFIVAVVGGLFTFGTAMLNRKTAREQIEATDRRFELATRKEYDEPINTLTNRTTVQNGLSDKFKFW